MLTPTPTPTPTLTAIAADVGGVVRIDHLAAASGMTNRAVTARITREGWWRPFPRVAALPGVPQDSTGWAAAATVHAGGGGRGETGQLVAVTGLSALALLGVLPTAPTRVEIVVPTDRRVATHRRLHVTRSAWLQPADISRVRGIPTTRGPALLRDLAGRRTTERLRIDLIELCQRRLVELADIEAMIARCPGFPGVVALRQVTRELAQAGRTDSTFEHRLRRRFSRSGIEFDRGQVAVPLAGIVAGRGAGRSTGGGDGRRGGSALHLDLGIEAIRFGIEADSVAFHTDAAGLQNDADRANLLAQVPDDWRVVHLTWVAMMQRWDETVEVVREVVAAQSRRFLGVAWPRAQDLRR